jgi:hypothetical protein
MMRWIWTGILAAVALHCRGEDPERGQDAASKLWFPIGEKLEYRLYWGVIPVGTAKLWTERREEGGRRYVALKGEAESNQVLKHIFPVRDEIESIVDPETFLPIRYVQKLKEGKHFRHDRFDFDHEACKAVWTSLVDGKRREIDIDLDTRDALTFLYYMRKKGFSVGRTEMSRVVVDEKVYDLEITGLVRETVNIDGIGKMSALKIEPKAKFGGIFTRGGKVLLWVSEDPRHILLRMVGVIPVATAKGFLSSVGGPGAAKWPPREGADR